jgi:hypothetical protein
MYAVGRHFLAILFGRRAVTGRAGGGGFPHTPDLLGAGFAPRPYT